VSIARRAEAALTAAWWRSPAAPLAQALRPLSWIYRGGLAVRSMAYALGLRRPEPAPVPVIVIGNFIAGGAGKTPTVIALVRALRAAGWQPGVVSRGHGRASNAVQAVAPDSRAAEVGDEPLLIRRRAGVPVWVGRRRAQAARALCEAHPTVDVIVADDGLQHRALARDVQLVVFDERGTGNGWLLPAGPLREPLPRHVPVNTHVLFNAAQPSMAWPGSLAERQLAGAVRLRGWWAGEAMSLEALRALRGRRVLAAAGLAVPQRFFAMLGDFGLSIEPLALSDHHDFAALPWPDDAGDVLVTEKDAVKLPPSIDATTRVWVVGLDFRLPEPLAAAVQDNLRRVCRPRVPPMSAADEP